MHNDKEKFTPDDLDQNSPFNINKKTWDIWADLHFKSDFYNTSSFLSGQTSLKPPELELVGNVKGARLLHLQCHFGLDTLSWARLGAEATGVDFSSTAITQAKLLANEAGIAADFYCENVLQLSDSHCNYDLVVSTYGVLCWLNNLDRWARQAYRALKPNGKLILVEFHPILEVLYPGKMSGAESYFHSNQPTLLNSKGSYAVDHTYVAVKECLWQHTLSDVLSSLINAGFNIQKFIEYPYSSYGLFDSLSEQGNGLWKDTVNANFIPYMYAVVAKK